MITLELIGFISTLLCVYYTVGEKIISWPIGIIGCMSYLILFYEHNLFGEMSLQIFFIFQSLIGWYNWGTKKHSLVVTRISNTLFMFHIIITLLITYCVVIWFNLNFLDIFTSIASILATYYLTKKILQNWILWIVIDLLLVFLLCYKDLYISALLYSILFIMAINGYLKWSKTNN